MFGQTLPLALKGGGNTHVSASLWLGDNLEILG